MLFSLFGFGVGSQLIGLISDWLGGSRGLGPADSLRYACLFAVVFHVWGALHFWLAAHHAREGYDRADRLESDARTVAAA